MPESPTIYIYKAIIKVKFDIQQEKIFLQYFEDSLFMKTFLAIPTSSQARKQSNATETSIIIIIMSVVPVKRDRDRRTFSVSHTV